MDNRKELKVRVDEATWEQWRKVLFDLRIRHQQALEEAVHEWLRKFTLTPAGVYEPKKTVDSASTFGYNSTNPDEHKAVTAYLEVLHSGNQKVVDAAKAHVAMYAALAKDFAGQFNAETGKRDLERSGNTRKAS